MSDLVIQHEQDDVGGEFFVEGPDGDPIAELTYRLEASRIDIVHTQVDRELEGRGVGKRLVDAAVAWARSDGRKVVAHCSFARAVLEKTPAYADVHEPS